MAARVLQGTEQFGSCRVLHRFIDSAEHGFLVKLLEQREQFEHCPLRAIAHRGNGAIIFPVEHPRNDRRGSFAARPALALQPPRAVFCWRQLRDSLVDIVVQRRFKLIADKVGNDDWIGILANAASAFE